MSKARLVITAVIAEKRPGSEVARTDGAAGRGSMRCWPVYLAELQDQPGRQAPPETIKPRTLARVRGVLDDLRDQYVGLAI